MSDNPFNPKCSYCGNTWDKPALMSDDSYSEFACPFPFHDRPPWKSKCDCEVGEKPIINCWKCTYDKAKD